MLDHQAIVPTYVCIVILQVYHSHYSWFRQIQRIKKQNMSERLFILWIISEANGKILSAHCNCMAGLGESCSHMVSLI